MTVDARPTGAQRLPVLLRVDRGVDPEQPSAQADPEAGPIEIPSQGGWCGHAGACFVGTAPVRWPTPLPLLI
jgi:hypothetical protein